VINLSLGGEAVSIAVAEAVQAALDAGVVIVASAGNTPDSVESYPAAYPGAIAVSAVAPDLHRSSFSKFGDWISVSAPGGDRDRGLPGILSTFIDEVTLQPTYAERSGTSMASPHVAGVAALVLSVNPDLTPAQVKQLLEATALDLGPPDFDIEFGWGMVNAERAVRAAATR